MRYLFVAIFITQALAASAIAGTSMRNAHASSGFFCKQCIPTSLQVALPFWLIASLFLNIVFISII